MWWKKHLQVWNRKSVITIINFKTPRVCECVCGCIHVLQKNLLNYKWKCNTCTMITTKWGGLNGFPHYYTAPHKLSHSIGTQTHSPYTVQYTAMYWLHCLIYLALILLCNFLIICVCEKKYVNVTTSSKCFWMLYSLTAENTCTNMCAYYNVQCILINSSNTFFF